jgi:hypothetical protein
MFPSMGPEGYLDTSERIYNSWIHNSMRLPGRPILDPWKGSGVSQGISVQRRGYTTLGFEGLWGMRDCRLEY